MENNLHTASRIAAVLFTLTGLAVMAFTLIAILPGMQGIQFMPATAVGVFLAERFSWAAFFVPVYFFAASGILVSKGFRKDWLFVLTLSSAPFFTVAALARFLDAPDEIMGSFPALLPFGVSGVAAMIALTAAAEFLIITQAAAILFSGKAKEKEAETPIPGSMHEGRLLREKNADAEAARAVSEQPSDPLKDGEFVFRIPEIPEAPVLLSPNRGRHGESRLDEKPPAVSGARVPDKEPGETAPPPGRNDSDNVNKMETPIPFESVPPEKKAGDPKPDEILKPSRLVRRPKEYFVPVEGILETYPDGEYWLIDEHTRSQAEVLKRTLEEFNIQAEVTGIRKGPVITMFEILPAAGVKLSRIAALQDNIALKLAAQSVRIVAPIPGKQAVGIEIPNERRSIVSFREMIESSAFVNKRQEIPVVLGKEISGEVQVVDLTQTPHLLIAGATGSGKSVCVNSIILSILYKRTPEDVKMIMIDPKIVELKLYNDIPHLLTPVITDPKRAFQALQYCICEMERRYSLLDSMGVRDIRSYNRKIRENAMATAKLPYLVVFIDEFADLMATTGKELESTLARLAAMSRAIGIHLVLATQRPSIDVITGLIKANIPSRIAFMVASKIDSRIILDTMGAEKLLGKGDMLYQSVASPWPVRMQGAFISEEEVERAVEHVKTLGEPQYIDDEIFIDDDEDEPGLFSQEDDDDPLMDDALAVVLQAGKASASYLQRRLKIGYNRAARLVELMEERGIVGPSQGSKPREIIHMPDRVKNRDLLPFTGGDVPQDDDK